MGTDNDKFVGPTCKCEITMRAFLLFLVATAGVVWLGRIDVINHAETAVISGSARLRGLQHYAVGVNTGGPKAPAAIDALWKGHLRFFTNIIIMGDVADAKRQIRTPPKRYYCTHNSAFGPSLDDKLVWKSHGRCTQLRFLYLVLTLREEFPDAAYYLLLDDDAWIDPRGLADLLGNYDTTRPWLMGPPHPYNTPEFQVGGMLVMSRRLVQLFDPKTLMQCASHWEFAADFGPKCQDGLECYHKTLPQFTWCTELLTKKCGGLKHAPDFQTCAKQLAAQENQCGFEHARPEYPMPMLWDGEPDGEPLLVHGDDHFLSFCAMILTEDRASLITQPCFHFEKPYRNGGGPKDNRPQQHGRNTWPEPPSNCSTNQLVGFHYVRPPQQAKFTRERLRGSH